MKMFNAQMILKACLHDFLQTTYEAAVNTSDWDHNKLLR